MMGREPDADPGCLKPDGVSATPGLWKFARPESARRALRHLARVRIALREKCGAISHASRSPG
jgi:hypothetical protein